MEDNKSNGSRWGYAYKEEEDREDVDLEDLLLQMHCGSQTDISSSPDNSLTTEEQFDPKPPGRTETKFLKSLPISIFSKSHNKSRKNNEHQQHRHRHEDHHAQSPMSCSAPQAIPKSFPRQILSSRNSSCTSSSTMMAYNIYVSDISTWHEVRLVLPSTCAQLIEKLLIKLERKPDLLTWAIIEQNTDNWTERIVEDCEVMDDLILSKSPEASSRYCLNKILEKYSILRNPELCLPTGMLTMPNNFQLMEENGDSVQRVQLQHILTKTAAEICGFLSVRDSDRKSWKKVYCVLRNSGLYYSSKNMRKDQRYLVSIADVHTAQVWYSFTSKRQHFSDAPSDFSFCLKPKSYTNGATDQWFCAESEKQRSAWVNSLRLKMDGCRFYNSFVSAQEKASTCLTRSSSERTIYRFEEDDNFAAMDFSGTRGRIIHDRLELASFKEEQRLLWKRKLHFNRIPTTASVPRNMDYGSPNRSNGWIARSMHRTQAWYFGKLSREDANERLSKLGNVDGCFLMRDSQTIIGGVVLVLVFNRKSHHYPVALVERHGEHFYTVDQGHTRFETLIHFVDFHRLNKGSLPCLLVHECSRSGSKN